MSERTRVFIYGSCVSRDTFEHDDAKPYQVTTYIARQSLISAATPPREPVVPTSSLTSPFQRRMVEWDARSTLFAAVKKNAPRADLLVWDLFDERLGVHVHPDDTATTRTPETIGLLSSMPDAGAPPPELVPFGSPRHRKLFATALDAFTQVLHATGTYDRTVLLAPSWAARTVDGEPTPTSFGITAAVANATTPDYLALVRDAGISVVQPPAEACVASPDHRWGLAPFHYADSVYAALLHGIGDIRRDRE